MAKMTYAHEFNISLDNSSSVYATIEENGNIFDAELILPPHPPSLTISMKRASGSFQTADLAFDWIVKEVLAYAGKNSLSIASVDNPCNTPFVSEAAQISAFQNNNITVTLLVNGE